MRDAQPAAAGFRELYSRYSRDVYRFALYLSGDRALADDLTSEAFLRIWQAEGEIGTVKGYLFTIVRNLYLHEIRRTRRQAAIPPEFPGAGSLEAETADREAVAQVMARLQTLPEADRTALLLRAHDDLPYEDIARLLGITVGAAKVKVHRARLRLAGTMRAEETCK